MQKNHFFKSVLSKRYVKMIQIKKMHEKQFRYLLSNTETTRITEDETQKR